MAELLAPGRSLAVVRTVAKQRVTGRPFKKGQSGNPNGRPRGTSNVVAKIRKQIEIAVDELNESQTPLSLIIEESLRSKPVETLKAIAPFMPRDVHLSGGDGEPLTIRWQK